MWTLIRAGGFVPMSFLMLFGVVALAAAAYFALRADRRMLGFIEQMFRATLFTVLAATATDIGATLFHTAEVVEKGPPYLFHGEPVHTHAMLLEGLAESTSPGIVGFSFLALTAMLTAVGRRRLDERERVQ